MGIDLGSAFSWVPEDLILWYKVESEWDCRLLADKRIKSPGRITEVEGKMVFASDSAGERWAFSIDEPGVVHHDADRGEGWVRCGYDMATFLVLNLVQECTKVSPHRGYCDAVEVQKIEELTSRMEEVDFSLWGWPNYGCRVFMDNSLVIAFLPSVEESFPWGVRGRFFDVEAGARERSDLNRLSAIDGISWLGPGFE
ncbi:hypothetical protein [Nocardiopsis protaetiae]|uniref:hypothetical protein n=1 Tax=Nocardiopsis protaetiae TaxID=3382270 RepID=UPI00387AC117